MRKYLLPVIVILVGAVVAWVLIESNSGSNIVGQGKSMVAPANTFIPPTDDDLFLVRKDTKIIIPEILSQDSIQWEKVPMEVAALVPSGATNISSKKIAYAQLQGGYLIRFDSPESVFNTYRGMQQISGWKTIYGSRTDQFALLDLEASSYKVHVEITGVALSQATGTISVINK